MAAPLRIAFLAAVVVGMAAGQSALDPSPVLRGVEKRYNSTTTMQANFTQRLKENGRSRVPERGVLYLNKKNHQTRWEYTSPAGNFFLSNDKFAYDYDKQKNTVERIPMKETEDMRVPLSFLLGTLDFNKDFNKFGTSREGENTVITATPKNDKLVFKEITMLIAPDFSIHRVSVLGQDGTTMEYTLEGEQHNPKLADTLFHYATPLGAQLVEARN